MDQHLVELIGSLAGKGWQGLITLYVVWAVINQFRIRRGKHNPSPEFHAALKPMEARLIRIESSLGQVDRRVARIEGHLDIDVGS